MNGLTNNLYFLLGNILLDFLSRKETSLSLSFRITLAMMQGNKWGERGEGIRSENQLEGCGNNSCNRQ